MNMEEANWEEIPKEVLETISDENKKFYGGLTCDVWVYSWLLMADETPEWVQEILQTYKDSDTSWIPKTERTHDIVAKGDKYLVIVKQRGVSMNAFNMTGEALLTAQTFEWGIADTLESAKEVIKTDQRIQRILLDMIGDEDALIERN